MASRAFGRQRKVCLRHSPLLAPASKQDAKIKNFVAHHDQTSEGECQAQ
jgi:hypothetical protein